MNGGGRNHVASGMYIHKEKVFKNGIMKKPVCHE